MPVAAWQWLVAGTVAVAAHGAIGLALLSPPAGGGGSAGKSVSVGLVLGAGDPAVEAVRAPVVTATEAAVEPTKVTTAPRPLQSRRVEAQRAPRPAPIAPSQQPSPSDLAAATSTRTEAASAVAKARAAPPAAPELPPLPAPRPEAAPDSGGPGDGMQTADAAGDTATQAQPEASAPGVGNIGRAEVAHEARAAYVAQLQAWLQRHKRYPQHAIARRQQGTATLYFVVDRTGRLLDYRLEQSSGHRLLDREALEMIERAAPLPRMPAGLSGSDLAVVLPVRFALR